MIDRLKKLLREALGTSYEARITAIKEFQNIVWNDTSIQDEELNDILTDIAYMLDFYEPNEEWRRESPNYYGNDRLEEVIRTTLEKLKKY